MEMTIQTRETLHKLALGLIRSVFPPSKGIRLVGVTLSNFRARAPPAATAPEVAAAMRNPRRSMPAPLELFQLCEGLSVPGDRRPP